MNLLPDLSKWYTYYPENLLPPEFSKGEKLCTALPKEEYSLGKWICDLRLEAGKTYSFTVTAETKATPYDVWAVISTHKADGSMDLREHAQNALQKDGYIEFSHIFEATEAIVSAKIELWIKGVGESVCWSNPTLVEREPVPPRNVSICMTYINPYLANPKSLGKNLENMLEALDNTRKYSPDIVVLSEGMYQRSSGAKTEDYIEAEGGKICKIIAEKAKELNSYLVYNFAEREGRFYRNTSLLFDRQGNTVGKYQKSHLTMSELESGLVPGDEVPVFETDFGKIGLITCWDQYFPKTAEVLAEKGAEIIFVPTAGDGLAKTSARAMDNGIYFATSGVNSAVNGEDTYGWLPSRIISPLGEVLAQTNEHLQSAHCVIDLNKKPHSFWLSVGPACTDPKGCYRFEKNPGIK